MTGAPPAPEKPQRMANTPGESRLLLAMTAAVSVGSTSRATATSPPPRRCSASRIARNVSSSSASPVKNRQHMRLASLSFLQYATFSPFWQAR